MRYNYGRSLGTILRALPIMLVRQAVPLTPSKFSGLTKSLSRQPVVCVSPLAATLIDLPANVANKRLTAWLTPLDATLTKNREGQGIVDQLFLPSNSFSFAPNFRQDLFDHSLACLADGRFPPHFFFQLSTVDCPPPRTLTRHESPAT